MGKKSRERMTGKTVEERLKESNLEISNSKNVPEPSQDSLKRLIELEIATINKENRYEYSQKFIDTFGEFVASKPGIIAQTKLANKVNSDLIPLFIAYGASFLRKGHGYENILEAYGGYDFFIRKYKLEIESSQVPSIIYGIYYLNEHKPEVEMEQSKLV